MILTSHQPNFLPYMGLFYKISKSDIFVVSEDVEFSKKAAHNWNNIYTASGPKKLTLPVNAHHYSRLVDVVVDNPAYNVGKIAKTLEQEYHNAPCFDAGMGVVDQMLYASTGSRVFMAEFNVFIIEYILERFCIHPQILRSTKDLEISGHKDERIFQMCEQTGADVYYSGTGAKAYHVEENYRKRGIQLLYSDYKPVWYEQTHQPFVPNLSAIDYIFNKGFALPDWS